VVSIKLPERCLGQAISVKFKGVSLNYPECGLDYIFIFVKCENFFKNCRAFRMDLNHLRAIRCQWAGAKIPRGLGLLKKEISLNRIVGATNQNVWVPPDVDPTRISHETTWVPHMGPT
jgi:hypothetical protein